MLKTTKMVFCVAVLLALAATSAGAAVIGLDARGTSTYSNDLANGAKFSALRTAITNMGHTWVPVSSFTAAGLAGLDSLILKQPSTVAEDYSATEVQDIQAFVAAGHGALIIGEGGYSSASTTPTLNTLVAPYGVQYSGSATYGSGLVVKGFVSHPVTTGLVSIGLDYVREMTSIAPPAVDLTTGTPEVLAVVDNAGGGGNVVLYSDASCWSDVGGGADYTIADLSNLLLFTNILAHITTPTGVYGSGCPGSGGFIPKLLVSPVPLLVGGQAQAAISEGLGGSSVYLFFGFTQAALPMGATCTLNVTPLLPLVLVLPLGGAGPGAGSLTLSSVVPAGAAGAVFTMQAFVVDPAAALGFSNSAGFEVKVK